MHLIDEILATDGLTVVFQPVVEIAGETLRLHTLECLTRGPRDTNAARADVMFEYVRRKRVEPIVDRACITAAFAAASTLPGAPRLSVNVHASTLGRDTDFLLFSTPPPTARAFTQLVSRSKSLSTRGHGTASHFRGRCKRSARSARESRSTTWDSGTPTTG